jgi:hypothetical protein
MDGSAHWDEARDGAGEGGFPHLTLDGFTGPLDHLLTLARAQKIEIGKISLAALVDQLVAALRQAPANMPLGQKGDWVVMAAWLVQLRARLLLPADAPAQQEAAVEADALRGRLVALADTQALAGWLERRPQLGHDVFGRGQPEIFGVSVAAGQAVDVVEFLWASLALFDDDTAAADTATATRHGRSNSMPLPRPASSSCGFLPRRPKGPRSSGFCRTRPIYLRVGRAGNCGFGRLGRARSSPGWNWPSRAMWCWGRGRISRRSMSPRCPLADRDEQRRYEPATT